MLTQKDRHKIHISVLEYYFSNTLDAPSSFMIISLYGHFLQLSIGQGTDNQPSLLTAAMFSQHKEISSPYKDWGVDAPLSFRSCSAPG